MRVYVSVVKWFILTVQKCAWAKMRGDNAFVKVCQCALGMNLHEMHLSHSRFLGCGCLELSNIHKEKLPETPTVYPQRAGFPVHLAGDGRLPYKKKQPLQTKPRSAARLQHVSQLLPSEMTARHLVKPPTPGSLLGQGGFAAPRTAAALYPLDVTCGAGAGVTVMIYIYHSAARSVQS